MTDSEFIEETSKIEKYYGKELETYQRKIWHEEIGHLKLSRYRQIIRELFRKNKFMPKLADIVEINNSLMYEKKVEIVEKIECNKCNGEGFVLYTKMFDNGIGKIPYVYFARCSCSNGNEYIYNGQNVQNKEHKSKYYVPSTAELGI